MSDALQRIQALVASDAYAISFPTMGQYRAALLREIAAAAKWDAEYYHGKRDPNGPLGASPHQEPT